MAAAQATRRAAGQTQPVGGRVGRAGGAGEEVWVVSGQGGGLGAATWSGVFLQRLERWIYTQKAQTRTPSCLARYFQPAVKTAHAVSPRLAASQHLGLTRPDKKNPRGVWEYLASPYLIPYVTVVRHMRSHTARVCRNHRADTTTPQLHLQNTGE